MRIAEIDIPEKRQPFGMQAKRALAALAFGKRARVIAVAVDRYGRTVGKVYVDGVDINATLVREGYAWVYRKYAKDPHLYELSRRPGPRDGGSGRMHTRSRPGNGGTGGKPPSGVQNPRAGQLTPAGPSDTAGRRRVAGRRAFIWNGAGSGDSMATATGCLARSSAGDVTMVPVGAARRCVMAGSVTARSHDAEQRAARDRLQRSIGRPRAKLCSVVARVGSRHRGVAERPSSRGRADNGLDNGRMKHEGSLPRYAGSDSSHRPAVFPQSQLPLAKAVRRLELSRLRGEKG